MYVYVISEIFPCISCMLQRLREDIQVHADFHISRQHSIEVFEIFRKYKRNKASWSSCLAHRGTRQIFVG